MTFDRSAGIIGTKGLTCVALGATAALAGCTGPQEPLVAPLPIVAGISPDSVPRGLGGLDLVVLGDRFRPESLIVMGNFALRTTFVSEGELVGNVGGLRLASTDTAEVRVVTPSPGGGSTEALLFRVVDPPFPVLDSISPMSGRFDAGDLTLTVHGAAFDPGSRVRWKGSLQSTEYASDKALYAHIGGGLLATGGLAEVTVWTPAPGGGTSESVTFVIDSPDSPLLSNIFPSSAAYGTTGLVLTVTGSYFDTESVIRWGGEDLPTDFVSESELQAAIPDDRLLAPGPAEVTVFTPGPTGGQSDPVTFSVVGGPAPVVDLLPSTGGHSGRPGFNLTIHGSDFYPNSFVRWNGVLRDAEYVSDERLRVWVSATDVGAPGSVTLSVVAPWGDESGLLYLEIRALGGTTPDITRVPLEGRDLVWDPITGRIYVSIGEGAATLPNSIVRVDPQTGSIDGDLFVGGDPHRVAASDDGQYLYVARDAGGVLQTIDLGTFVTGPQWSLPAGDVALDVDVAPGEPQVVSVVAGNRLMVYDSGVARPDQQSFEEQVTFMESPSLLYGFQPTCCIGSRRWLSVFRVDGNGVHLLDIGGQGNPGVAGFNIAAASGRVYGPRGEVMDPLGFVEVGTFGADGEMAIASELGRAFFRADGAIRVHDLNNFQYLGTIVVDGVSADGGRVVRWGNDGLALLEEDGLILVRSPIIGP